MERNRADDSLAIRVAAATRKTNQWAAALVTPGPDYTAAYCLQVTVGHIF